MDNQFLCINVFFYQKSIQKPMIYIIHINDFQRMFTLTLKSVCNVQLGFRTYWNAISVVTKYGQIHCIGLVLIVYRIETIKTKLECQQNVWFHFIIDRLFLNVIEFHSTGILSWAYDGSKLKLKLKGAFNLIWGLHIFYIACRTQRNTQVKTQYL